MLVSKSRYLSTARKSHLCHSGAYMMFVAGIVRKDYVFSFPLNTVRNKPLHIIADTAKQWET